MDDVVFDFLGTELSFALGFVGANRIGGFEIKTRLKQRFQHRHPRLIFAVVEGEGQNAAGFQDTNGFAPALGQQALIIDVRIFRLPELVSNCFESFWCVVWPKMCGVAVFKHQAQPHIKKVG
jgi:hypothetical protein